ncbi:hypothetical protein B7P43_G00953 [Cryptotermes secundus]|uniref:Sodium channel and clathrin linker 1 n=1 Tax=Cryptotermes secundus TaxID=105785 RepID=A0A2J7PGH0_9NEOP|nr:hypothetical protein B7P43_G00953 [Cryptotermes secundus]
MDLSNRTSKEAIPAPSDVSQYAKTNLLPPLLLEYEAFIETLQQQIDFYKTEHTTLRSDLMDLITENRHLSDKLKDMQSTRFTRESTISPRHRKESDMLTNLRQQLSLVAQEKDSAVEMWHIALQEVDNLDEALKSYQDNRHVDVAQKKIEDVSTMQKNQDFVKAITMLETKLTTTRNSLAKESAAREEAQKRLEESLQENASLKLTLESRKNELEEALEGQCATARKLQEIEKKAEEFQEQVETLKKAENDLESALTHCHDKIDELVNKNFEAHEKVSESLHLVECAMAEKDAAILREAQIREENVHLQKLMASIVDEAGARVKEEVENIKQQYNKKLEVLVHDMKKLEDLQKEIQEKYILEGELQKIQVESPLTVSVLEKKLTMAHDEILDLKRCNMQLSMEKENLHSELERLRESHALDIRKMNMECHFMEEQILGLQTQLEAENQAKSKISEHAEKLEEQARLMEQELERRRLMFSQDQPDWQQQQHGQDHHQLMTQIQEIQKQSDATASELEHHLERQHLMKTKYQKAMKSVTQKLVLRLQDVHSEVNALRKENKQLKSCLQKLRDGAATHKSSQKND